MNEKKIINYKIVIPVLLTYVLLSFGSCNTISYEIRDYSIDNITIEDDLDASNL